MQDLERITFTQKADIRKADSNFVKVKNAVDNVEGLISSESTRAASAESALSQQIEDVETQISNESTRATNAESDLNQQVSAAGHKLSLSIGATDFVLTISLLNKSGTTIDTKTVDLPLEEMVINASYDSTNKKLILILKNGQTIEVPISGVISGLVSDTRKIGNNNLKSDITQAQLFNNIKDVTGTFTNKTINADSNTITNIILSCFKSGIVKTSFGTTPSNDNIITEKLAYDSLAGKQKILNSTTIKSVSVSITGWSTARTGVYKKAFTISGLKATDVPIITLNLGDSYTIANATQNKKDYNNFLSYACAANSLTIFTSKIPEQALNIYVLGVGS